MGKQKQRWRNLARFAAFSTAGLSALRYVRARGKAGTFVAVGKMMGTALAPVMTIGGMVSAVVAGLTGAPVAVFAGLAGAVLSAKHVDTLNAPHGDSFAYAFGDDWLARIPDGRRERLRAYPTAPLLNHPGVVMMQDVVYHTYESSTDSGMADDRRQAGQRSRREMLCDLWLPPEDTQQSGKAFIYLHGSAWHFTDKDTGTRAMFRHLASLGHVCMDVSYRLCPEVDWAGMLEDTQRAVSWMKAHAEDYGVDPQQIILAGGSAGGQLALLNAYTANNPNFALTGDADADVSVRAVVAWYGVTDLRVFHTHAGLVLGAKVSEMQRLGIQPPAHWNADDTIIDAMLRAASGGLPDEVPDVYVAASPVSHVGSHCPPTLLLQGEHDVLVKVEAVRDMAEKLKQAGVPTLYVEYPQVEHAFDVIAAEINPAARAALYETECFLELV